MSANVLFYCNHGLSVTTRTNHGDTHRNQYATLFTCSAVVWVMWAKPALTSTGDQNTSQVTSMYSYGSTNSSCPLELRRGYSDRSRRCGDKTDAKQRQRGLVALRWLCALAAVWKSWCAGKQEYEVSGIMVPTSHPINYLRVQYILHGTSHWVRFWVLQLVNQSLY